MPSKTLLKMDLIERVPGIQTNMILPTQLPGKLRPTPQLVINIGLRKIKLPRREAKSLCRWAQKALSVARTASGAMIQIDSLLGMTNKRT